MSPRSRARAVSLLLFVVQLGCPKESAREPNPPTARGESEAPLVEPLIPGWPAATENESEAACGSPGLPECPLQAWMDNTLNTHFLGGQLEEVAADLAWLAARAPEELPTWTHWTSVGIEASRQGDRAGVEAACAGCHRENRARYRRSLRNRDLLR